MKIVQEQILFDCLEQFEAGASVEELVAKYPHATAEIEKFLAVAAHLQQLNVQPGLAAKRQSQKLFLDQAAQLRIGQRQAWFSWRSLRRTLLPLASLAMVTILFGLTLLFASASALPGDLLYDAKRWVESYQLEQAGNATAVFNLNAQMNQERVREVKAILRTDEVVEISFKGRINTKQGNNWVIAGVPVKVYAQTEVEGYAGVGTMVLVNGRTQNGHLYASRIVVLQDAPATPTPAPSVTVSPTPTTTMTATPTTTATGTAPATPTATMTTAPTVSATPTGTSTPAEMPPTTTAVPPTSTTEPTIVPTVVADNDNDNESDDNNNDNSGGGNDNGNDNSDDDNSNDNAGGDNGNDNSGGHSGSGGGGDNGNDNSGNDNGNDNSGGDNDNDNSNDNEDNDNSGGNSGSGGGDDDNDNDDDDNDNDNGRRDDD